jgi:Intracellular proteinase inhibitor
MGHGRRRRATMLGCRPSWAGVVFVALLGSAGCRSSEGNGPGSPPLALHLEAPVQARAGEKIRFKLKVKNTSGRALDQPLAGQPPHDFVVTRTDGTELWRWSRGEVVRDVLELKTFQAGEEVLFEAEWNQRGNDGRPLPPGRYAVRGVLNADPPEKLETKPRPLVIEP